MTTLKEQKEAFVSGYEGTSPFEILLVCSSGIVGYWLFSVLPLRVTTTRPLSTEVYLFWLPMILVQSHFLYPWGMAYLLIECLLALIFEMRLSRGSKEKQAAAAATPTIQEPDPSVGQKSTLQQQHGALTMHRSIVMYLTFVAILAVDFPLFPRRFVKTETKGYSLMDVGAASFSLVAGLASPRARTGRPRSFQKELWRMAPLIFMGSLRLLTHQELEYQEHVSEYGVHWNFFYTLATLGPLTALVPGPTWMVPTAMMIAYQYLLSNAGVQSLIEDAPRECSKGTSIVCNLFMANREGLLGCVGYTALYLMSEWIGKKALWTKSSANALQLLCYMSAVIVLLWGIAVAVGVPISRRSTNLGFILWSLVVNLPLSACVMAIYNRHGQVPYLACLVNQHGLACFILANLLTGIVNLSINTLQVGNLMAIGILLGYLTAVGLFAMLLECVLLFLRKDKKQA